MEVRVTTLYDDGTIGVRESYIKKATSKNDVLHIKYEDNVMSMDPESLVTKLVRKSTPQQSKFNQDEWYVVYYYMWEPNLVSND